MKTKCLILFGMLSFNAYSDVNDAVNNFFSSMTADVNVPTVMQNQSAGIVSFGGIATRSKVVNLQPMTFTPPSFNTSCGNLNFYSGALTFMTNTDQLIQFMQNTLMTAGVTAIMTALKAATPNIAGTLQSMFDAAQKMLGMFNNSCQLGMALGNSADSWMYDRLAKAKGQAYGDSADASSAEINATTSGSGGSNLTQKMNSIADNYHNWVNKNANMNPADITAGTQEMAAKYGSVIWKGLQALHLYSIPTDNDSDVPNMANLIISLTGDLIIYPPNNDGTGTATRRIPPTIVDLHQFMTSQKAAMPTYNCSGFNTGNPSECVKGANLATMQYPTSQFNQGIIKKIQIAIDNIQLHFTENKALTDDDKLIIAIAPMPIFAIAQTLDDIGMAGSINNVINKYSKQIAFEILQKLINVSFNLANQAASARSNKDTQQAIQVFTSSISDLQSQVNSYAALYVENDPIEILQRLNYLRSYAQNLMSPMILQKVNFAKQMGTY
jgi:conjugative transfer pilus assembly protein TraH